MQYGHARIASILRRAGGDDEVAATTASLAPLVHETELALARRIAEFPRAIQAVVDHLAPHRLARYARDVAADFHAFYTECKVLDDNRAVRLARLALCLATMSVLANALICSASARRTRCSFSAVRVGRCWGPSGRRLTKTSRMCFYFDRFFKTLKGNTPSTGFSKIRYCRMDPSNAQREATLREPASSPQRARPAPEPGPASRIASAATARRNNARRS